MSSLFKDPNYVLFKYPVVIMKEIMSWMFKDLISSGLAQFNHPQSNSKKWSKGEKVTLPQLSILQSFKKVIRTDPEL